MPRHQVPDPQTTPSPASPSSTPTLSPEDQRFAAFAARMAEVEPVVAAIAGRAGLDPDDLTAHTWIRGWERCGDLASLQGEIPTTRAYLVRIAEHLVTDLLRRQDAATRRLAGAAAHPDRPSLVSLDRAFAAAGDDCEPAPIYAAAGAISADPHSQLVLRAREGAVRRAIDALPKRQRVALQDFVDGIPARKTARTLRIEPSVAYHHLRLARRSLAASLSRAGFSVPAPAYSRRSAAYAAS